MSEVFIRGDVRIHHDDFRGDVVIETCRAGDEPQSVRVPFCVLVAVVADWARHVRIAQIEAATDRDLLGLPRCKNDVTGGSRCE